MITTLATAYKTAERVKANGMVTIQDKAILPIREKSIVFIPDLNVPRSTQPFATPAPTTPITWQWVVEVGIPAMEQIITTMEAVRTTVNPSEGVILLILDPMVTITLFPKQMSPIEIPIPPHK